MKKSCISLFSFACTACVALGVAFIVNDSTVVAKAEVDTMPILSETKVLVSNDNEKMLLATAIKNQEDVYEVGYTFDGEVMPTSAETKKYYSSISNGEVTVTAEDIFSVSWAGDEGVGMIIWEVEFEVGETYSYKPYALVGERLEDGQLAIPGEEIRVTPEEATNKTFYTVTIEADDSLGSVSQTSVLVPEGTKISVNDNVLSIGGIEITATAKESDNTSTYSFVNFSGFGETVTGNMTITANFKSVSSLSKQQAMAILTNKDSYQSHYHGAFKGVTESNGNITVTAGTYSSNMTGFGLKKTAVQSLIALGAKSVTFTMTTDVDAYIDVYGGGADTVYITGDLTDTGESHYVKSGTQITIDLIAVVDHLGEEGLKFVFAGSNSWTASTATSVTYSDISFDFASLEEQAMAILTDESRYQVHYYGAFTSVTENNGDITVGATHYGDPNFSGFAWRKTTVQALISLGVKSVSFTMTTDGGEYVDIYGAGEKPSYVTGYKTDRGNSHYVASGSQVTLDLLAVVDYLDSAEGLKFVFTSTDDWVASKVTTSVTYSDITFEFMTSEEKAMGILTNKSTYQVHYHGEPTGVTEDNGNITVTAKKYQSSFIGFGWTKAAVQDLVNLGYETVTFTVTTDTNEYVCIYGGASAAFLVGEFTASSTGGYVQSGTQITINLAAVVSQLGEEGLKFVFTNSNTWTASTATSITYSNITFA